MPWAVVGAVGGALITSSAASDASDAQTAAAQKGVDEQRHEFDTVQQLLSPFINAAVGSPVGGTGAAPATGGATAAPGSYVPVAGVPAYNALNPSTWQYYTQDGSGGASLKPQYRQAQSAMGATAGASGAQGGSYTRGALPSYLDLIGLNGDAAQKAAIAGIQSGSQFGSLTKQAENAILQNASATGGLRGGNVQNALATNRENLLSSLIDKQLERYGGIVQMGQNSAAGVGTAALTTGQGIASLLQQQGAAQAGGTIAAGNAITNALGNVGGFMASRNTTPTYLSEYGGGGGFGTGVVYGNQDYGQYF